MWAWDGRLLTKPDSLSRGFEIPCSASKQLCGPWHSVWLIAFSVWSPQDLREKNWKAMEALTTVEKACEEKLLAATKAKVSLAFPWHDVGRETLSFPKPLGRPALACLPA